METIKVLYIECNQKSVHMVASMLESCGDYQFEVGSVAHVRDAMEELGKHEYDIILSGLMVADAGGPEIAQKLSVSQHSVPLIFLVKDENIKLGREMISYGAQDYLSFESLNLELLKRSVVYAIERQRLLQRIQDLSMRDDLTKLYNRRGFKQFSEQQLRITNRTHQLMSLIFVDLDNLKVINDTHGHHEGDHAIQETAEVLRSVLRVSDIVGRLGGDEFVVLAPDTNVVGVEKVIARVRESFVALNQRTDTLYQLEASIGTVMYNGMHQTYSLEELQSQACEQMYKEKKGKKNAR